MNEYNKGYMQHDYIPRPYATYPEAPESNEQTGYSQESFAGGEQQQQYMPPLQYTSYPHPSDQQNKVACGLCYAGFWVSGLLFLLFERNNRLVRFHAIQSLIFFGGVNVLYIVLINLMHSFVPFVVGFAIFAFVTMNIVALVAWIVGMANGFSGRYYKLPFVGDIAEQYTRAQQHLK